MLRYRNVTTIEHFKSYYLGWAGEKLHSVPEQFSTQAVWKIISNSGNTWTVTFTGRVGEFTIEGRTEFGTDFKVWMYLSGDIVEIHKAFDEGRNIRSDRLLKKYKELACMVSCYFMFGLLR